MADRPENHPDEKNWKPLYNDPETEMPKDEKDKGKAEVEKFVKAADKAAKAGEADAGSAETPARREIAVPAAEDKK